MSASRLHRHLGSFEWSGVQPTSYKATEDWRDVTRRVFVGESGESADFHVRYFEVAPGGFTTLERHHHEHCVVVLRGQGQVLLDCERLELAFGDVLYVAPEDSHQFRNDGGSGPLGLLCIVNAKRDRPRPASCG